MKKDFPRDKIKLILRVNKIDFSKLEYYALTEAVIYFRDELKIMDAEWKKLHGGKEMETTLARILKKLKKAEFPFTLKEEI